MAKHYKTHKELVYEYLVKFGSIDGQTANRRLGVLSLSTRINELTQMGVVIDKGWISFQSRSGKKCPARIYKLNRRRSRKPIF